MAFCVYAFVFTHTWVDTSIMWIQAIGDVESTLVLLLINRSWICLNNLDLAMFSFLWSAERASNSVYRRAG
jgi:hypothetical protein